MDVQARMDAMADAATLRALWDRRLLSVSYYTDGRPGCGVRTFADPDPPPDLEAARAAHAAFRAIPGLRG